MFSLFLTAYYVSSSSGCLLKVLEILYLKRVEAKTRDFSARGETGGRVRARAEALVVSLGLHLYITDMYRLR